MKEKRLFPYFAVYDSFATPSPSRVIIKRIEISSSGVANDDAGVANDNVATPHISPSQAGKAEIERAGVANVAKCSKPSNLSEDSEIEEKTGEKKKKQIEVDKGRDFATPATFATPSQPDKGLGKRCADCKRNEAVVWWQGDIPRCRQCQDTENKRRMQS